MATCKVPVLACQPCRTKTPADVLAATAKCRLCRDNFAGARRVEKPEVRRRRRSSSTRRRGRPSRGCLLGICRSPLKGTRSSLRELDIDGRLTWLVDRETSLFYGSAVVECGIDAATKVVSRAKLPSRPSCAAGS